MKRFIFFIVVFLAGAAVFVFGQETSNCEGDALVALSPSQSAEAQIQLGCSLGNPVLALDQSGNLLNVAECGGASNQRCFCCPKVDPPVFEPEQDAESAPGPKEDEGLMSLLKNPQQILGLLKPLLDAFKGSGAKGRTIGQSDCRAQLQ